MIRDQRGSEIRETCSPRHWAGNRSLPSQFPCPPLEGPGCGSLSVFLAPWRSLKIPVAASQFRPSKFLFQVTKNALLRKINFLISP